MRIAWFSQGALYTLSTNMIEGWEQTVVDVERLRDEAIALGAA